MYIVFVENSWFNEIEEFKLKTNKKYCQKSIISIKM